MSKLFAAVSTLTTLAVLATSGTAFAGKAGTPIVRDHRHAATPPAANSPPPAAYPKAQTIRERRTDNKMWYQGANRQARLDAAKKRPAQPGNGGQNSPRSGGTNQER